MFTSKGIIAMTLTLVKNENSGGLTTLHGLLTKTILQRTVKGKRREARQKKRWEENMTEWAEMNFDISAWTAEDSTRWKGIVVKSSVVPQRPSKVMGID